MTPFQGIAVALLSSSTLCAAQVRVAELATPPADARRFTIMSTAGTHGNVSQWTTPDGTLMGRMSVMLRGQVWEEDEATTLGADGAIASYRLRGSSPNGDVGETFGIAAGTATWKSPFDGGSAAYGSPAWYLPAGWSIKAGDLLIERLVATPGQPMPLLPGGKAHLEKLTTLTVGQGAAREALTAWAVVGISGTPFPGLDRQPGQGFRMGRRPDDHTRRLRIGAAPAGTGAGCRAGRTLARAGKAVGDGAGHAGGLRRCACLRRRYTFCRASDGDRQPRQDHRGRAGRQHQGACQREGLCRRRADAGPRVVGFPHARQRRLQRPVRAVARCHLDS